MGGSHARADTNVHGSTHLIHGESPDLTVQALRLLAQVVRDAGEHYQGTGEILHLSCMCVKGGGGVNRKTGSRLRPVDPLGTLQIAFASLPASHLHGQPQLRDVGRVAHVSLLDDLAVRLAPLRMCGSKRDGRHTGTRRATKASMQGRTAGRSGSVPRSDASVGGRPGFGEGLLASAAPPSAACACACVCPSMCISVHLSS